MNFIKYFKLSFRNYNNVIYVFKRIRNINYYYSEAQEKLVAILRNI